MILGLKQFPNAHNQSNHKPVELNREPSAHSIQLNTVVGGGRGFSQISMQTLVGIACFRESRQRQVETFHPLAVMLFLDYILFIIKEEKSDKLLIFLC